MHSRVFQLEETFEEIEDNHIYVDDNLTEMGGSCIDYVDLLGSEGEEWEDSLDWLVSRYDCISIDMEAKTLTINYEKVVELRKNKLEELKDLVANMTLDEFNDGAKMYKAKTLDEEMFGFKVYCNGYISNLDEVLKWVCWDKADRTYYIGKIYDYHS